MDLNNIHDYYSSNYWAPLQNADRIIKSNTKNKRSAAEILGGSLKNQKSLKTEQSPKIGNTDRATLDKNPRSPPGILRNRTRSPNIGKSLNREKPDGATSEKNPRSTPGILRNGTCSPNIGKSLKLEIPDGATSAKNPQETTGVNFDLNKLPMQISSPNGVSEASVNISPKTHESLNHIASPTGPSAVIDSGATSSVGMEGDPFIETNEPSGKIFIMPNG